MASRIDTQPEGSGANRTVQLGGALAVGLVLGAILGRLTAPSPAPEHAREAMTPGSETREPAAKPDPGTISGLVEQARDYIDSDATQQLSAVGDIIKKASVSDLLDWSRAPEDVSRRIVNEMSDDELISTITSVTKVDAEDLKEYSDLRDYANRLSHIAMSGIITPDLAEEFDGVEVGVTFASDASASRGPEDPSSDFSSDTRKIYAVIPNSGDAHGELMVHWYRVDQPRNLLFDQYRVSPDDNYSYVWLKSPSGGWDEGEYRVEFYSADEYLTPIASGTYRVHAD